MIGTTGPRAWPRAVTGECPGLQAARVSLASITRAARHLAVRCLTSRPGPVEADAPTVADAMLVAPVVHPLSTTVSELRDFFRDDHVHAALMASASGRLAAVVERGDLAAAQAGDAAAAPLGLLAGRTVPPEASLAEVHRAMVAAGRRRVAVTGADGRLLGLLCLKASGTGFCSDQNVRARALDRARS
jgi:hypothetical protein